MTHKDILEFCKLLLDYKEKLLTKEETRESIKAFLSVIISKDEATKENLSERLSPSDTF